MGSRNMVHAMILLVIHRARQEQRQEKRRGNVLSHSLNSAWQNMFDLLPQLSVMLSRAVYGACIFSRFSVSNNTTTIPSIVVDVSLVVACLAAYM